MGGSAWMMACWTNRSTTVGIPNSRFFPLSLGISTLRTGLGRYVPCCKELVNSFLLAKSHGSNCSHDILSIPTLPLLPTTALYAQLRLSGLRMSSYKCALSNGTSAKLSSHIHMKVRTPSYLSVADLSL